MTVTRARRALPLDVMDPHTRVRVAFYGRISKNRKHASESIPGQRRKFEADLRRHPNWSEVDRQYLDDNRSASRYAPRQREGWPALLADVPAGRIQLLWVWEWSRGNRDVVREFGPLIELLAEHGVLLYVHALRRVFDPRNPKDVNDMAQESLNAARESEVISRRVSEAVMDGMYAGTPWGTLRYGYQRTYDPYSRKLISQGAHPTRADIVREVCKRYADNEPQLSIADDLTARGVETPADAQYNDAHPDQPQRRSRWTDVAVQRMACSPVYIGQRVYKGGQHTGDTTVFDGQWEQLVDYDTHIACVTRHQRASELDAVRRPGRSTLVHLLTGIMRCGVCGDAITVRSLATGPRYRCYKGCSSAPQAPVDAFVVATLLTWCARPDVAKRLQSDASAEAVAAKRELANLQHERQAWIDQREVLGPKATAESVKGVDAKISAVKQRLVDASVPPALRTMLGSPRKAAAAWQGMTLQQQRAVIEDLMDLKLQPAGRGARQFIATRSVTIEWRL